LIQASDDERGLMTVCDNCDMAIEVPAIAIPVARAVPVVPVARAIPAVPVAKAVPAAPKANAKTKVNRARDDDDEVEVEVEEKPRRKRQTNDDDNDDGPRSKASHRHRDDEDDDGVPAKSGGKGLMIALIAIGALVLLGGGGGLIWYLTKKPKPEIVVNETEFDPNDPFAGLPMGDAGTNGLTWKRTTDGDGFSVDLPESAIVKHVKSPSLIQLNGEALTGTSYTCWGVMGLENYGVYHYDLSPGFALNQIEFANTATTLAKAKASTKRNQRLHDDKVGTDYTITDPALRDFKQLIWTAQVGQRVFLFSAVRQGPSATFDANAKRFFDSIRVTYTPPVDVPMGGSQDWKPIPNADGFVANAPKNATKTPTSITVETQQYFGVRYQAQDGGQDPMNYVIYQYDIPASASPDFSKMLQSLCRDDSKIEATASRSDAALDGKKADDWVMTRNDKVVMYARTAMVADRLYVFTTTWSTTKLNEVELQRKFISFVADVKITYTGTVKPKPEIEWVPIPNSLGFTALAPKNVNVNHKFQIGFGFGDNVLPGSRYVANDAVANVMFSVFPITPKWDAARIIKELIGRDTVAAGPTETRLGGEAAEERMLKDFFQNPIQLRTATKFGRVFAVRISMVGKPTEKVFADAVAQTFDNFKFTDNLPPALPNLNPNPLPVRGQLAFAGRIEPFWAGVPLPVKSEFIAFGSRDGAAKNRAGTLRRYSYPDFKLTATYQLPNLVTRAVADEKKGVLYCTIATKDNPLLAGRDPAYLPGAVHVYDLKIILDGSLKEGADLKPLNVFGVNGNIAGLELAPDGAYLYVATQTPAAAGPRAPLRGKIYRFDMDKLKPDGEIDHPDAISQLRVSKDGKRLAATILPVSPLAPLPAGRVSQMLMLDASNWKKNNTWPLPGLVGDATFADDSLLALVLEAGNSKALQVSEDGSIRGISPDTGGKPYHYLRARADGNYALATAGYGADGAYVIDVKHDLAKVTLVTLASGDKHDDKPIGGQFVLTPDNKYAIMNCGSIIDLAKSIGR